MNPASVLRKKIERKSVRLAVVGLGYAGLPLATAFAQKGVRTVGIDISADRVEAIRKRKSYIDDLSDTDLGEAGRLGFRATTRFSAIRRSDATVVCVPTPLGKTKQPDLSHVFSAVQEASRHIRRGHLVVLESTTYPGTTDEHLRPMIEEATGLKAERDFYLGFSPERVDPANRHFRIEDIPKVVGGVGPVSTRLIASLYRHVFARVVVVSSARTAELVKLLENTFRSVNIGLANEMAMVARALGIDIWEVIEAAKTKPFGFMPFYPGPGIGGHCINIDPMYLAWKARLHGYEPRLIELAQTINDRMPEVVAGRVAAILNDRGKPVRGAKIGVLGLAYKKNVRDTRESPALAVLSQLVSQGARFSYHDPHVARVRSNGRIFRSRKLSPAWLSSQDLVVILTDHDAVDYALAARHAKLLFDTRNSVRNIRAGRNVIRL